MKIPVWGTDTVSPTIIQTPSSDEDFVTELKSSAGLLRLKPDARSSGETAANL